MCRIVRRQCRLSMNSRYGNIEIDMIIITNSTTIINTSLCCEVINTRGCLSWDFSSKALHSTSWHGIQNVNVPSRTAAITS